MDAERQGRWSAVRRRAQHSADARLPVVALLSVLGLLGCEPIRSIAGHIHGVSCRAHASAGTAGLQFVPLGSIEIIEQCGGGQAETLAQTDAQGRFSYKSPGYWDDTCKLELRDRGGAYQTRIFSLADFCRDREPRFCSTLQLSLDLFLQDGRACAPTPLGATEGDVTVTSPDL